MLLIYSSHPFQRQWST